MYRPGTLLTVRYGVAADQREDLRKEWRCLKSHSHPEVLVSHANARTTMYARKLLVDRVLAGHRPCEVAKLLGVSRQTVY